MSAIFLIVGLTSGLFIWITDGNLWLILIATGICLPYLGRLGYINAMKTINISRASIIVQSQPFFAAGAALIILGTFPPIKEIIGGLLIVAGVIVIKMIEKRMRPKPRPVGTPGI